MGKLNKDNKGFGTVELLMAIVIVVLLGVVGWYVYKNQHKTTIPTIVTVTKTVVPQTTTTTPKTSAPATVNSPTKTLDIKEWGVKASYSSDDTLTYLIESNSNGQAAILISANLVKSYQCSTYGAGAISRVSAANASVQTDPGLLTVQQQAQANPDKFGHVGDYYYSFVHDQASCSSTVTASAQNTANTLTQLLVPKLVVSN